MGTAEDAETSRKLRLEETYALIKAKARSKLSIAPGSLEDTRETLEMSPEEAR